MAVQIKYFASLRDRLGRAGDRLEVVDGLTVAGVWATLWPDTPLPPNTLTFCQHFTKSSSGLGISGG